MYVWLKIIRRNISSSPETRLKEMCIRDSIIRERAVIMGKFDYKFVEVPCDGNLKNGNTETLERCKEIIMNEAAQG